MKIEAKAKIKQAIEITNNDTGEKEYLIEKNNEWIKVNEQKYNKIIRGED